MANYLSQVRQRPDLLDNSHEDAFEELRSQTKQEQEKAEQEEGAVKVPQDAKAKEILKKVKKWREGRETDLPDLEKTVVNMKDVGERYFMPDTADPLEPFRDPRRKEVRREFKHLFLCEKDAKGILYEAPFPPLVFAEILGQLTCFAPHFLNFCADKLCAIAITGEVSSCTLPEDAEVSNKIQVNALKCIQKSVEAFAKRKHQDLDKDSLRAMVKVLDLGGNKAKCLIAAQSLSHCPLQIIRKIESAAIGYKPIRIIAKVAFRTTSDSESVESERLLCKCLMRWMRIFSKRDQEEYKDLIDDALTYMEKCLVTKEDDVKQHALELLTVYPRSTPEINKDIASCLGKRQSNKTKINACEAVRAMGRKGRAFANNFLPLLVDDDEPLRELAVRTLGEILSEDTGAEDQEFTVKLVREKSLKPLGIDVDLEYEGGGRLRVAEIFDDGTVNHYNAQVAELEETQTGPIIMHPIHPGDRILSVNGVSQDCDKMMAELQSKDEMTCIMQGPFSMQVSEEHDSPPDSGEKFAYRLGLILSNDPCQEIRCAAATSLSQLGVDGQKEILALVRGFMDPTPEVRKICKRSIHLMAQYPMAGDIVMNYIGRTNACSLMRMLCVRTLSCLRVLPKRVECAILCEWFVTAEHSQIKYMEHVNVTRTCTTNPDGQEDEKNLRFPWSVVRSTSAPLTTYVVFHGCDVRNPGEAFDFCDLLSQTRTMEQKLMAVRSKKDVDPATVFSKDKSSDRQSTEICILESLFTILRNELLVLHHYLIELLTEGRKNSLGVLVLTGHGKGGIAAVVYSMLLCQGMFKDKVHTLFNGLKYKEINVFVFGTPNILFHPAPPCPNCGSELHHAAYSQGHGHMAYKCSCMEEASVWSCKKCPKSFCGACGVVQERKNDNGDSVKLSRATGGEQFICQKCTDAFKRNRKTARVCDSCQKLKVLRMEQKTWKNFRQVYLKSEGTTGSVGHKKSYVLAADPVTNLFGAGSTSLRNFYADPLKHDPQRSMGLKLMKRFATTPEDQTVVSLFGDLCHRHTLEFPPSNRTLLFPSCETNHWYSLDVHSMPSYTDAIIYEYLAEISRSDVAMCVLNALSANEEHPVAFLTRAIDQWAQMAKKGGNKVEPTRL